MAESKQTEYKREFNKETYKTIKVYIRKEEYPAIVNHMNEKGYEKISEYIKNLIKKDMAGKQSSKTVNIGRDNTGTINM